MVGVIDFVHKPAVLHITRVGVLIGGSRFEVAKVALIVILFVLILAVIDILAVVVHPYVKITVFVDELPNYLGGYFGSRVAPIRLGTSGEVLLNTLAVNNRNLGQEGVKGVIMGGVETKFQGVRFVSGVVDGGNLVFKPGNYLSQVGRSGDLGYSGFVKIDDITKVIAVRHVVVEFISGYKLSWLVGIEIIFDHEISYTVAGVESNWVIRFIAVRNPQNLSYIFHILVEGRIFIQFFANPVPRRVDH